MQNEEKYLSTGQLMDYLEISRSTVYQLMAKGMPNIMVGSVHRYPVNQVVGWLENQSGNKLNNRETAMVEI
jgi:excisionase family DNA binding protein